MSSEGVPVTPTLETTGFPVPREHLVAALRKRADLFSEQADFQPDLQEWVDQKWYPSIDIARSESDSFREERRVRAGEYRRTVDYVTREDGDQKDWMLALCILREVGSNPAFPMPTDEADAIDVETRKIIQETTRTHRSYPERVKYALFVMKRHFK